jgi:hypothetical protein
VLGWRTAEIHQAILGSFALTPQSYSLTQLRYDVRKLKGHGLLEREGRGYAYRLTDNGTRAALLSVLFHQRVCGPLANSLFYHRPTQSRPPMSKIEAAYQGRPIPRPNHPTFSCLNNPQSERKNPRNHCVEPK